MADLWRTIAERHGELLSALGQHIEISLIEIGRASCRERV